MSDFQRRAGVQGRAYEDAVVENLTHFGWQVKERKWVEPSTGVEVDIVAIDRDGIEWWIECKGSWESDRNGLSRTDTTKKLIGTAALLSMAADRRPYMVITSDLPGGGRSKIWLGLAEEAGWLNNIKVMPVL